MALKSAVQQAPIGKPLDGMVLIFVALFVVFLVLAVVGQLLNWNWRTWFPGAEGAQSMWGGVRSAVYTVISHLS
jgi:light-harvesting complex 1 beta chain